jgi:prepilin-type N-terminal cleavage/methylation domain-containing protein
MAMSRFRSDERGFTLVELLIVMVVAMILLTGTLLTFERMVRESRLNEKRQDIAQQARTSLDLQARQLRNLAQRISNPIIDRAAKYDFIFQTSDPQRTWVRYCLDTTGAGASPSAGKLWEGTLAVPVGSAGNPVPSGAKSTCPGPASQWTKQRVVAQNVTNRMAGKDRPIFTYSCTGGGSTCATTATTFDQIIDVSTQLFIDTTPGKAPPEVRVATGVYMRNQNQAPKASFTVLPAGNHSFLFNASGSTDYEGRTLQYYWFQDTFPAYDPANPATTTIDCSKTTLSLNGAGETMLWGGHLVGRGITLDHQFPSADWGLSQAVKLVVCDPGYRFDVTSSTSVTP